MVLCVFGVSQARLAALQARYEDSLDRKQQLEADSERTRAQLVRAEQLVTGLADEGVRWAAAAEALQQVEMSEMGWVFLCHGQL